LVVILSLLGLWMVIGLFFWIPMLSRGVASFTAAVVQSAIRGGALSETDGAEALGQSIDFFPNGFRDVMLAASLRGQEAYPPPEGTLRPVRLLGETIWAFVVWGVVWWVV
jgi:hypothetical protein